MRLFFELFSDMKDNLRGYSFRSTQSWLAIKATIASLLALCLTWEFNIFNPVWAALTAFFVVQITIGATMVQTLERILATIIGAFSAIIIIAISLGNFVTLVLLTFIYLLVCFYYLSKSKNPFIWLYVPITVLLISYSTVGKSSIDISNFAYYRAIEISIGSVCGLFVSWLFWAPTSVKKYKNKQAELFSVMSGCIEGGILHCQKASEKEVFENQLSRMLSLIDEYNGLRRFVKYEPRIGKSKSLADDLDVLTLAIYEANLQLLSTSTDSFLAIGKHFAAELRGLMECATDFFEYYSAEYGEKKELTQNQTQKALKTWEESLASLMKKVELFRNSDRYQFSIKEAMAWNHFIRIQYEIQLMLKAYLNKGKEVVSIQKHPNKGSVWERLLKYDRYYFEYALKTAFVAVFFPIVTLLLDLPSGVMLSVLVVISLQFDLTLTKRKLIAFVVGCSLGAALYMLLIFFSISAFLIYVVVAALLLYALGYFFHSDGDKKFVGLFASVVFLIGATKGLGPVADWRSIIILLVEIWVAAFCLLAFLMWAWPFTDKKVLKHHELQIEQQYDILKNQLLNVISSTPDRPQGAILWAALIKIRCEISKISNFNWRSQEANDLAKKLLALYGQQASILFSLTNIMRWNMDMEIDQMLLEQLRKCLQANSIEQYLNSEERSRTYLGYLRSNYQAGKRLPFSEAMTVACIASLIEAYSKNAQDVLKINPVI